MNHNPQQNWGTSKWAAITLFLAPFIAVTFLAAAHLADQDVWSQIDTEDGIVEWFQFVAFGVSACLCFSISYRLATQWSVFPAVLYSLLGLGLTFVAGEEIAWGQRVLGFDTPPALAQINEKRETSVHNVG